MQEGVAAAVAFIEEQIESGALDGGVFLAAARRRARAAPAHALAGASTACRTSTSSRARRSLPNSLESGRPCRTTPDKLIRQLSLVAFWMAERRPLTARDKQNVEGYQEMSDEAFARYPTPTAPS